VGAEVHLTESIVDAIANKKVPQPRWLSAAGGICMLFVISSNSEASNLVDDRRATMNDWQWDPVVMLNMVLVLWLYQRGWVRVRRSSKAVKSLRTIHVVCFLLSLGIIGCCIMSPLDVMSSQLASAHMVQHTVLMTVAAPLMAMGSVTLVCFAGLPQAAKAMSGRILKIFKHTTGNILANPLSVWMIYAVALWGWHLPVFYGAALRWHALHDLQHLMFFGAALLFWRPLLDPLSSVRLNGGTAVIYLFATTLHSTLLGVFMTIAPSAWYREYFGLAEVWGWSPLEDQQMAGLIMWMPACIAYAVAAVYAFARLIQSSDRSVNRYSFAGRAMQ